MIGSIDPRELHESQAETGSPMLLDVRSPEEFAEAHAQGAVNIPMESLNTAAVHSAFPDLASKGPLYVICRSGRRSLMACEMLAAEGYEGDLVNVNGGTSQWLADGLPSG